MFNQDVEDSKMQYFLHTAFRNYFRNSYIFLTDNKWNILRTASGKEYVNEELKSISQKAEIQYETSFPNTPEQNELAERMNRSRA